MFVDLGYSQIAHPQDAKFHRSLVRWERDGCLYGAIALLHDIDRYWDAPGGAIVRYDPATGQLEKIGIPLPHIYIQTICLDQARGMLYGASFTPERLFSFDLNTYQAVDLGPLSSGMAMAQGENVELDDDGCVWCGWTVTRAWQSNSGVDRYRLCKYDPKAGRIHYLDAGLPRSDGAYGYLHVEGLFNLGPGRFYASAGNGSLYRLDPATGQGTYLGTPIADRPSRLTMMRLGPDGAAYGITGRAGQCEVLRLDPATGDYQLLGPVVAEGEALWQGHDVAVTPDGVLYVGENDVPHRSGYLWEIVL
jgi:sugar lactone lactonase YvrE